MNTGDTYFVHTLPSTASQPFTITVTPDAGTVFGNPYKPEREAKGVCPSCGRCRECGHKDDPWEDYWRRPWWAREWVPPYQVTWSSNAPNGLTTWTIYG